MKDIVTSHSINCTFDSCERRFEFGHIWSIQPPGGNGGFAASTGTAGHEAVQEWSRIMLNPNLSDEEKAERKDEAYLNAIFALLKHWPWILEEYVRDAKKQSFKDRGLGQAILLLEQIIEQEIWNEWELLNIEGFGLSIEVPWRIVHSSLGTFEAEGIKGKETARLVSQGKIDWILRNKITGEIRIWDLKNTTRDASAHAAAFRHSGQGIGYGIILEQALGFDWRNNGLRVSYLVANYPTIDKDAQVDVRTYTIKPHEIEEGIVILYDRLEKIKLNCKRGFFPRSIKGCESFGQVCPYFGICHTRDPRTLRLWFAFEQYEQRDRIYDPIWTFDDGVDHAIVRGDDA